ncbi:MAG: NAD+ synthase [Verrucomicrobia bacterium]|nr:NAD+ synthase [Verrucomicrobiota bacterium]
MKIALAQINTTVGDFPGNTEKTLDAYRRAAAEGAELVVLPELTLAGYPPRDLLLRESFVEANLGCLKNLAGQLQGPPALVGFAARSERRPGRSVANAAALLHQGRIQEVRHKTLLPTYDVFDEDRYFEPAETNPVLLAAGRRLGVTICEDLWNDEDFWPERRYCANPAFDLRAQGIDILVNLSASPWHLGKERTRRRMLSELAVKMACPLAYCNLVGGNDELVFDGQSLLLNGQGRILAAGRAFEEDLIVASTEAGEGSGTSSMSDEEAVCRALVLGLRDYVRKCGFKSVVLGLSGGIDSALVASLAAEALGPEQVLGVSLPSRYSSQGSLDDARELAQRLGIRYEVIPIQPPFESVKGQLRDVFGDRPEDTTEENIQARLRGVTLMALSNKFGSLLLTTGNKSEMAVGYCTLYGDMCGGLAVISDVPKTLVYRLARWINRERVIIPEASVTKPPSAELRPNQTDQDSLPPYETLDAILEAYVVEGRSSQFIAAQGHSIEAVRQVVRLIDMSEYKRRQAAPGLKVTTKAFGMGRRIPIAQRYREWQ